MLHFQLAWLNLLFFPLLLVVIVLPEFEILSRMAQHILVVLLLAAVLMAMIFMAKMPWRKETVEDERDRRYRQKSFTVAYFVLVCCLSIWMIFSIITFPKGQVSQKFVVAWIGIAYIASVLGQSVAVLILYKKGVKDNS